AGPSASQDERRCRRSGSPDDQEVRVPAGAKPGNSLTMAQGWKLPSSGGEEGLDSQAGQQGETPIGNTHGSRPGGASSAPRGVGTDFRTGLCQSELWVPPESGLQGCTASRRQLIDSRISVGC